MSSHEVNNFIRVAYVIRQPHFLQPLKVLVEIVVKLFIRTFSEPHPNPQPKLGGEPIKLSLKGCDDFHG